MGNDQTLPEGRFILIAYFQAKPGQVEAVKEHLKSIQTFARANEPGTYTFRPVAQGDDVVVFEEYESPTAFAKHQESADFIAFKDAWPSLLAKDLVFQIYEEF